MRKWKKSEKCRKNLQRKKALCFLILYGYGFYDLQEDKLMSAFFTPRSFNKILILVKSQLLQQLVQLAQDLLDTASGIQKNIQKEPV